MHEKWSPIVFSVLLGIGTLMAAPTGAAAVTPAAVRPAVTLSGDGWKFMFDPRVAEDEIVQVGFSDRDWETVVVPHSFNAQDGQSIQRTMKRGPGYYRLTFEKPASCRRPEILAGVWRRQPGIRCVAQRQALGPA